MIYQCIFKLILLGDIIIGQACIIYKNETFLL